MRLRWIVSAGFFLVFVTAAYAAPPEEAIIPLERYTTQKARSLATTHQKALRQIYDVIYHCYDWMEIPKRGIGFITPKGVTGDARYLNLWVWIDQQVTPAFAAAPAHRRAEAMFEHYGLDLLRRLSSHPPILEDPAVTGFGVVLSWTRPDGKPSPGVLGVNETLSVFIDKVTLQRFFKREAPPAEFIQRAIINGFDGTTELGRHSLEILDPEPVRVPARADSHSAC